MPKRQQRMCHHNRTCYTYFLLLVRSRNCTPYNSVSLLSSHHNRYRFSAPFWETVSTRNLLY